MSEFTRNLAVVIGVNEYGNGIAPLQTAVNDARELARLLKEEHGYEVWQLLDREVTFDKLKQLLDEALPQAMGDNDRLLFYFAGHGIALDGEDGPAGYLVSQDARLGDSNTFFPMQRLHDALAELSCRHLLVILDCCFAGAFRWSSTRDLGSVPETIYKERYDRFIQDAARQVITSASYDQKALDVLKLVDDRGSSGQYSPFASALFAALRGEADAMPPAKNGKPSGDGVITATELYLYLRDSVELATEGQLKRQTPGLWPLRKHDKGEFIFLAPGHALNLPPAPELNKDNNPYQGLESFDESHSKLFFGRERLVKELQTAVAKQPLTIVVGASGTGKSSLVKAGLLPALRASTADSWRILDPLRPGESPLTALARACLELNEGGDADNLAQIEAFTKRLGQEASALANVVQQWSAINTGAKLLLIIDQLEELVTLCRDEQERQQFLAVLEIALVDNPGQLSIVMTLRSDFEPQFIGSVLKLRWMDARYVIKPMTQDELRQAVEGPASERVLYFEPSTLIDQLINEVVQTPGALPLLSFTLSELYLKYLERRGDNRALTQQDYEALGGVAGSLTQRATQEYDQLVKLDTAYQQTMQRVMLRMVVAEGGKWHGDEYRCRNWSIQTQPRISGWMQSFNG